MALEVKDALKAMGLPENIEDIEGLVSAVGKKFVERDKALEDPDVRTKAYSSFSLEHSKTFLKEFGLDAAEVKDKTLKEIMKLGASKLTEKITELEGRAGQGNDEKVKELNSKMEKLTGQLNQFKTDNEKLINEKVELETNFNTKLKNIRVDDAFDKSFAKLSFVDGVHDYTKKGFSQDFRTKYKIDLDDHGNTVVTDSNGEPIKSKTKTGVYLSLDEVMDAELDAASLKKKNNMQQQRFETQKQPDAVNTRGNNQQPNQRAVNPRAQAHADTLANKG